MQVLISALLFVTSVMTCKAAMLAKSPFERAMLDAMRPKNEQIFKNRQTRSATGGVPCVTVQFLSELQDRFRNWLDHNNDGLAEFHEVQNYIRRFKPNVSNDMVAAFISRRDANGNGGIDFVPEYVQDLSSPDSTLEGATEWFQLQDTNDDGSVSAEELTKMARAVGMSPEAAMESVQGYYMGHDENKDGVLSFDEFKSMYNQKR